VWKSFELQERSAAGEKELEVASGSAPQTQSLCNSREISDFNR
jgi:hypothetical protein